MQMKQFKIMQTITNALHKEGLLEHGDDVSCYIEPGNHKEPINGECFNNTCTIILKVNGGALQES